MKLTSPNVTKSKRRLHWCRSISKNICAGFITVSVKKLLHYRAGGLLQYRAFLLHYRAVITLSGVFFITLSGTYYSIGRLLHYRLVQVFTIYHQGLFHSVRRNQSLNCLHRRRSLAGDSSGNSRSSRTQMADKAVSPSCLGLPCRPVHSRGVHVCPS